MLILEEQRYVHEDLERLEQGIADRIRDDPKHVRFANQSSVGCLSNLPNRFATD